MNSATPASMPATTPFRLAPLLVANLACTMSMMAFSPLVGPIARMLGLAPWHAGFSVMIAGVLWVLTARWWGAASDRYGRRRILLTGIGGFAVSFAVLTVIIDVSIHMLPTVAIAFLGLVIGRGAVGLFYAAIPAAGLALVADNVPEQKRTGVMASLGAANAVGMVVGPALAALLAQQSLSLPLYAMGLLPLIAFVVMWKTLPRTEQRTAAVASKLKLSDVRLRRPMTIAFVAMFSVAIAQISVSFYALDRLGLPPVEAARTAGIALTVVGVALIFAQIFVRKLSWPPARLVYVGGTISGLGFAAVMFASTSMTLWACYFVAAAGMGLVFPAFSAMAANNVQAHEQGATAGTMGAAQGCGMVAGPLVGTVLYDINPAAPYLFVGAVLVVMAMWPQRKIRST
jgi:DHA1 family tetracycline resistance protein-like MFS transporter